MIRYRYFLYTAAAFLTLSAPIEAAQITFNTDPFEGSDALTTPGRQVVGGEVFIDFSPASDTFAFDADVFGIGNSLLVFNGLAADIPATGVNLIVLRTFDNDADTDTPFGAGNAANLIADQITTQTPGFFIYFNSGLDLARLVFSTDLSDNASDLKILARMTNLAGQDGRDALESFTGSNFALLPAEVPEPSTFLLMMIAIGALFARAFNVRQSPKIGSHKGIFTTFNFRDA